MESENTIPILMQDSHDTMLWKIKMDASELQYKAALQANRPFMLLKPLLFKDTKWNIWCCSYTYGDTTQLNMEIAYLTVYGDTPEETAIAFDKAWHNMKV